MLCVFWWLVCVWCGVVCICKGCVCYRQGVCVVVVVKGINNTFDLTYLIGGS